MYLRNVYTQSQTGWMYLGRRFAGIIELAAIRLKILRQMSVRLATTHKGNVYEILADFLLTLLGSANPQRRQFDEGYDFYCSLSNEENGLLTFDFPFTIQIKSGSKFEIKYGKQHAKWKLQDITWLYNHSTPFFVGFINKHDKTLSIYDTTGIWYLYGQAKFNCSQIVFKTSNKDLGIRRELPKVTKIKNWKEGKGDGNRYEIDLGNPLITISIEDIDKPEIIKLKQDVLKIIIAIERENITNRNLGIHCFKEIKQNTTNKKEEIEWGIQILGNYNQEYISRIYESISYALISLSINLDSHGRSNEVDAIKGVLKHLPDHRKHKQLYDQNKKLFDWVRVEDN